MKRFFEWLNNLHWLAKGTLLALALVVVLSVIILIPYALSVLNPNSALEDGFDVEYVVTGTVKKATITFTNEKGWTKKVETEVPWHWRAPAKAATGTSLYLSAQARDSGFIKVRILVDGKLWKEQEKFGPFVMATASGYAGDK